MMVGLLVLLSVLFLLPLATLQSSPRSSLLRQTIHSVKGFVTAFTTASLASQSSSADSSTSNIARAEMQMLLKDIDYDKLRRTVNGGGVFIQDDFVSRKLLQQLREDMNKAKPYKVSGLSDKGKNQQDFSSSSDRSVCPVVLHGAYSSTSLQLLKSKLDMLRHDLAISLNRPTLSIDQELYYSIGNPGSYLKRHMDERHPELSKRGYNNGNTRRSISFLIYLSDDTWDMQKNGGQLRTFPQKGIRVGNIDAYTGGEFGHSGCLQVGWLSSHNASSSSSNQLPSIQPLYLDAFVRDEDNNGLNSYNGKPTIVSKLFVLEDSNDSNYHRRFVSDSMEVRDPETGQFEKNFTKFLHADMRKAGAFVYVLEDIEAWIQKPEENPIHTEREDINAKGGRFVCFDSVLLPHEVCIVKVRFIT